MDFHLFWFWRWSSHTSLRWRILKHDRLLQLNTERTHTDCEGDVVET